MKVVLVHYHLKTGGVTTVVKQQIAALHGAGETLVLTGDRARAALPCPVVEIAELGYDRPGRADVPEIAAAKVLAAIDAHWPGGCDVVHVHNPTLAKNRQFLKIIKRLQEAGVPIFLQIHDFAEEGRPGAYFGEAYPEDAHYGVINRRDGRFLIAAGLDPAGVHHLPNAVMPLPVEAGLAPARWCSTRCAPSAAKIWAKRSCSRSFSKPATVWPSPSPPTARRIWPLTAPGRALRPGRA